jgi:hypothetical protein
MLDKLAVGWKTLIAIAAVESAGAGGVAVTINVNSLEAVGGKG